jgi:Zn-dependent peptidase ImmA (M78 family)
MGKATLVPITPEVLDWAIRESGYSPEEVAEKAHVSTEVLRSWLRGEKPTLTQFRGVAKALKRTPATFLLPAAPEPERVAVKFRHPPNASRTQPSFEERRYLREALRLQDAARWIMEKLGESGPKIPLLSLDANVEKAARSVREQLLPLVPTAEWRSHAQAFNAWRSAVEQMRVSVLVFPLGDVSARGFSLWDDRAPVIAINSGWNHAARIFTLFHEYGHLLTRTSSVCLERTGPKLSKPSDPAERWCEEFAAAVLLPWDQVTDFLTARFGWHPGQAVESLEVPKAIASAFKVSWRAATIRLIQQNAASWALYSAIPPLSEQKQRGGGGGEGRDRGQIRVDQYGDRTISLFFRAFDRRIIGRSGLLDYLDVPDTTLDRLHASRGA